MPPRSRQPPQELRGIVDKIRANAALKLAVSLLIDVVGCISYLLPLLGEIMDVPWAPLSAYFIYHLYGSTAAIAGFVEELAPGLDFVPTATLAWGYEQYLARRGRPQSD